MVLDILTGILVAFGFYQGFSKGLIKTVFATLSVLVAVVAALKLSPIVISILQNTLSFSPALLFVIGFVLTFIITMALVRFIGNKLEKLFEALHIGGINKLLGGGVLGLFYAILISFGVYFADKISLISDEQKEASFTYELLEPLPRISQGIGESLKPMFNEFWTALINTMDSIKDKGEEISK